MDMKQKNFLRKEERLRQHLEQLREENNKKRTDTYDLYEAKKNRNKNTLSQNEEKMRNRIKSF